MGVAGLLAVALVPAWAYSPPPGVIPVTLQAQEANAAFLAYAPAPAGGAGALCLVDTGVNSNPDTQNALVSATAIDGGTGADVDPLEHGTMMAMVAGADGHGMWGAWPQIKIVSVRSTTVPQAGQEPTYEFDDYWKAIQQCLNGAAEYHVKVINLALASPIPPSPDQAANFATAVGQAHSDNIALVAAAGNSPGAIQEPGAEPGVLAVGAYDTLGSGVCSFSATTNLTFYAPGCDLNFADPSTDAPDPLAGRGTSQASAFAAAVLVALMSYDPSLTYTQAENLLISTASGGELNATAAFDAAGLQSIVAAGNANIPKTTTTTTTSTSTSTSTASTGAASGVTVTSARWKAHKLTLVVAGLPSGDRLAVQLRYKHAKTRNLSTLKASTVFRTAKPSEVLLTVWDGTKDIQGPINAHVS
jgi:hypothetical protein